MRRAFLQVERHWRRVLGKCGGSPRLWQAYLVYRRTAFGSFSVSSVRRAYAEVRAPLVVRTHT